MNDEKDINETIESAKEEISSIAWRIQELRDDIEKLLSMMEGEERAESEENFSMLINAGFNVGTKFHVTDNPTVWTITGICEDGFVAECDKDGEHKKEIVRTSSKRYVTSYISNLKILKESKAGYTVKPCACYMPYCLEHRKNEASNLTYVEEKDEMKPHCVYLDSQRGDWFHPVTKKDKNGGQIGYILDNPLGITVNKYWEANHD